MKFFEDIVAQEIKTGYLVCGDTYVVERLPEFTVFILCDGIGSGIYANIAAITCAQRMLELLRGGMSLRAVCEMAASSMHRARKENIPFSAFAASIILHYGQFVVYTYEAPEAILIKNNRATVLKPHFYTAGYEVIGEVTGQLDFGEALILASDGVTQAGMGHGLGFGIASEGVATFINKVYKPQDGMRLIPRKVMEMCKGLNEDRYQDDTTLALLQCREAKQITVFTGPPSRPAMDAECVAKFMEAVGQKVVCGSSTAEIVARELGVTVDFIKPGNSFGLPPEYVIEGIDLVTEGAVMLNQVYNIMDEPADLFVEDSVVERFCLMLLEADVINLMIGNAVNDAHEALIFKQVGVRVRRTTVKLIAQKLRKMGKLVIEEYY